MKSLMIAAAALVLSMAPTIAPVSVAQAREVSAPEGCWLELDREGTWICCRPRKAKICTLQDSQIPSKHSMQLMLSRD